MYTTTIERHTQLTDELLQSIINLTEQIPEFDRRYSPQDYFQRLHNKPLMIQIISIEGELAGFKIGYSEQSGLFYSWLGAILPEFRQLGLAKTLLNDQEKWAKDNGYITMEVTTYNRFSAMLQMLIQQGYKIAGLQKNELEINNNKLILNKNIN
ncbi:GNAT family N-acetyltransferase [Shewanella psychrotolerans]|uniref:GNAT family N-acetyltransferase n=1 Tax=Shewanella psychrotolerans TaxID=2864206 RepID=UPI001C66226B|nr:GNAT family N-acetyltransferase [Shewanella psychrotolerans]QYK01286.1 GNAT family N-acetyltransferase [Shewanella psychrotolerans]